MTKTSVPTLSSMTGFARHEAQHGDHIWVWEVRSVNGRGLDLRTRTPPGFDDLDIGLKTIAAKALSRGNVNASLSLTRETGGASITLNTKALSDVMAMVAQLRSAYPDLAPATPEGILSIRGVIETTEDAPDESARSALIDALQVSFAAAIDALALSRQHEGLALAKVINNQIGRIEQLTDQARKLADELAPQFLEKLRTQINELIGDSSVAPDRLAQEVALLAVKADIREELDRLDAHIGAARDLMGEAGAVGRKFDFLVQEFNREANTLCSKAADIALKQTGLDLKTVIDQMREQIQNVE